MLFFPQINYVTVASKFVKGVSLNGEGTLIAKFAGAGKPALITVNP